MSTAPEGQGGPANEEPTRAGVAPGADDRSDTPWSSSWRGPVRGARRLGSSRGAFGGPAEAPDYGPRRFSERGGRAGPPGAW